MAVDWFLPIVGCQYRLFITPLLRYSTAVFGKGWDTDTSEVFSWFPTVPQSKCREVDHIRILPNAFQFIWPFTIRDVISAVK
jgi:hypothetical protein